MCNGHKSEILRVKSRDKLTCVLAGAHHLLANGSGGTCKLTLSIGASGIDVFRELCSFPFYWLSFDEVVVFLFVLPIAGVTVSCHGGLMVPPLV
eukprot:6271568-Ditylum_brightwellii.AAC.1